MPKCHHSYFSRIMTMKVESCNTTVSLQKATTCRIKSHIRHIIYPILTVYDSMGIVVYHGFTVLYFGRGRSHTFAFTFLGFPPKFSCSHESSWEALVDKLINKVARSKKRPKLTTSSFKRPNKSQFFKNV